MTVPRALARFRPRGVFWRHFLAWAVTNIPVAIEPVTMWLWSFFFFVLWAPGRRAVTRNLGLVLPGSWPIVNFFRTYRVFLNFAWTLADNARYHETGIAFDWEVIGEENLATLAEPDRKAIVLTAHMGNYDIGSFIFSKRVNRTLSTVRAPEVDPETQAYAEAQQAQLGNALKVRFNTSPSTLALDLVEAISNGEVVAIQGDRAMPGVTAKPAKLFGVEIPLPIGPFALAMATRAEIFPIFIIRAGRRRYRVVAAQPFQCMRTSGPKEEVINAAMKRWTDVLEATVREHWYQWFAFERVATHEHSA